VSQVCALVPYGFAESTSVVKPKYGRQEVLTKRLALVDSNSTWTMTCSGHLKLASIQRHYLQLFEEVSYVLL